MKKKMKKIAVFCLTAGCLTLGAVGAVAYATGNPYENYKNAVVNTVTKQNLTVNASVQMKQNGNVIASGSAAYQKSADAQYAGVSADIAGQSIKSEEYSDGSTRVQRENNTYSVENSKHEKDNELENLTPNMIKLAEMTADLFVGDLSNQFTSSGNTISVSLTDTQIPEIANVAAAAFTEMNGQKNDDGDKTDLENQLAADFPIVKNARIESVDMSADLNNGTLSKQSFKLLVSGNTASGEKTQVEITVNADITEIGTTTPQTINTVGLTESKDSGENHED